MSSQFICDLSYVLIYCESAGPDLERDNICFFTSFQFQQIIVFSIITNLSLDMNASGQWLVSQGSPPAVTV